MGVHWAIFFVASYVGIFYNKSQKRKANKNYKISFSPIENVKKVSKYAVL